VKRACIHINLQRDVFTAERPFDISSESEMDFHCETEFGK